MIETQQYASSGQLHDISYSYDRVPTIKRFAASNSRLRVVIGPFGCLSSDTEYLTPDGWKRFDSFAEGDIIAEYDPKKKNIIFREPKEYLKLPCESFLHLKNRYGIDQLLSDEHTVLFTTRFQPDKFQTITASELAEKHNSLSDGWSGRIPTVFGAPASEGINLSDDELRLMVAISADGSFPSKSTKRCYVCLRRDRKKERLRYLLKSCCIDWIERNYERRPTETIFVFAAPECNKNLWKYFNGTNGQLSIIVDEFVHWDGCRDRYGGKIFSSTSSENADLIQYALATQGIRSTIAIVDSENERWNKYYRVYAGIGGTDLSMRQAPKIERVNSQDGFKYCFTTETGFFIARRNGRIFITGNSGKSSGCTWEIPRRAMMQRPIPTGIHAGQKRTRWAIVRNSYRQLSDTTMKTVLEWFPPYLFGTQQIAEHNYIITGFPDCHIELMFRALDRPDQVSNLLSLELTGAWFNEMREIPWAIVDAMDGRIGRYPSTKDGGCTWKGIIGDSNPPDEESDLYKFFFGDPDNPDWTAPDPGLAQLFKQPSGLSDEAENLMSEEEYAQYMSDIEKYGRSDIVPGLDPLYYKVLAQNKPKDFVEVNVHGNYGFVKEGKPVYEHSWSDALHVSKQPLKPIMGATITIGMDYGLTPAAILTQISPRGYFYVLRELVSDGIGIRNFMRNKVKPFLNAEFQDFKVVISGDQAGAQRSQTDEKSCEDIIKEEGFEIHTAPTNDLVSRIGSVEEMLGKPIIDGVPTFQLDPRCRMLRKGFNGGYHYKKLPGAGGSRHSSEPVKNQYSHPHDGLQYAAMHILGKIARESRRHRPAIRSKYQPATRAGY